MDVLIVNKNIVDSLNEMNTTNHKVNVIELTNGKHAVNAKLIAEPLFKNYHAYFETCELVIDLNQNKIVKPEIIL